MSEEQPHQNKPPDATSMDGGGGTNSCCGNAGNAGNALWLVPLVFVIASFGFCHCIESHEQSQFRVEEHVFLLPVLYLLHVTTMVRQLSIQTQ